MNKGSLFIVTGPSGAGKGAVLGGLQRNIDNVFYSVSATTRLPRPGEVDGVNYYFLTRERFQEMIANGELLEHAEYVGNYYGTPEGPVNDMLAEGKDVILEIEVQGALIVKEKRPDAILVFIAPPSFEVLESRLRGRGTERTRLLPCVWKRREASVPIWTATTILLLTICWMIPSIIWHPSFVPPVAAAKTLIFVWCNFR